jgi:hypothetical protein
VVGLAGHSPGLPGLGLPDPDCNELHIRQCGRQHRSGGGDDPVEPAGLGMAVQRHPLLEGHLPEVERGQRRSLRDMAHQRCLHRLSAFDSV